MICLCNFKENVRWGWSIERCNGARVAQSVKRPTSVQVMISRLESLSLASGSVLSARSLEPALDSVSPSLSAPPRLARARACALSLKNKQTLKKFTKKDVVHTLVRKYTHSREL